MKKILLVAALAATVAAPAFAQSASTLFAIQEFNMSAATPSEVIQVPDTATVHVSSHANNALGEAFHVINASEDSSINYHGQTGATAFSGTPAHGAAIFARLRAASLENEN